MRSESSGETVAARPIEWRDYVAALWRRRWLMLAIVIACPAIAYGLSVRDHKQYTADALIQVRLPADQPVDGESLDHLRETAQVLAQTTSVKATAASAAGGRSALGMISVRPDSAGFITVSSTQRSPSQAAVAANAYARATIAIVIAQASSPNAASFTQAATPPTSPSSPRTTRNTVLGALIGLALAFLAAALIELADRRFRTVAAIERAGGTPVLSTIPRTAFKPGRNADQAAEATFARLRARLVNLENERPISTLIVVSAAVEEGKTLVSTNLAEALARAGNDVLVLDADLRRPRLAERVKVEPAPDFAAALTGGTPLEPALVEAPLAEPSYGRLRVLASGKAPATPSELLESGEMLRTLDRLKELSDIVVIDSSPLLAVPDAVSLLPVVDGVLLVVRLGRTRSDLFRETLGQIRQAHAHLLGVVVTGTRRSDPYYAGRYLARQRPETPPVRHTITARHGTAVKEAPPPVAFAPPVEPGTIPWSTPRGGQNLPPPPEPPPPTESPLARWRARRAARRPRPS